MIDLSSAVVVFPPYPSGPVEKSIEMLIEEVDRRSRIRWNRTTTWPPGASPVIAVGRIEALKAFDEIQPDSILTVTDGAKPEGYRIRIGDGDSPVVLVAGNDDRGVLFGVGHLLRKLEMGPGSVFLLEECINVDTSPRFRLRGHMLGYWDKSNTYCAWGPGEFEQYMRDLAIFGTNTIELIPPHSGDRPDSPHFTLPPLEMMERVSHAADEYGLDVWIWYPALDGDYGDPDTVKLALEERKEVFARLPRIDAVFVPGGDPGKTPPGILMVFLERQKALLRRYHPEAEIWISPQGFSDDWMREFVEILEEGPDWLDGVVFGPGVHMSTEEFRDMIPGKYPIRHYPDITHSLSCQYPVPDWDIAYALTEGREPINPRPRDHSTIFRYTQPHTIGFSTDSEGCNDDVNKIVWSSLGWDPDRDILEVLRDYSRYFIGPGYTDRFARGLLSLEENWRGSLVENDGVYDTLSMFQAMEESATPEDLRKWRFQQALYRAYYDAYVRSRLLQENGLEERAMSLLGQARFIGSLPAMDGAEEVLDMPGPGGKPFAWRTRVFQLAEALYQSIQMQLSVPLYRAQAEDRGANLDAIDYPLSNGPWLKTRLAGIRGLGDEDGRLEALEEIIGRKNPGPGGFYDDLGSEPISRCPRISRGRGYEEDPGFWKTSFRMYPHWKNPEPIPLAWRGCTGTLKDTPFEMHYTGLDADSTYRIRVVYSDLSPDIRVRLEANEGVEIHPWITREDAPVPKEFDIPAGATREGTLTLRWQREPGKGGTGRGCQISEIWLMEKLETGESPKVPGQVKPSEHK